MTGDDVRTVRAGRRTVEVHRPDKVLFPGGDGAKEYTKGDLVDYYRSVAPFMLPHLRGRPLMLERHPDGVAGPRFMQKNTPDSYPEWIGRVEVPKEGGTVLHTVCDDTATLLYLADQASLTLHRWLSRAGSIERPDRMVFDLDPAGEDDFGAVHEAAQLLGELLDALKLPSALMTTGSRGLHVVVPLNGRQDFDEVREFAKDVADTLVEGHPDRLTTAARKKDRGDRLYLDVQRNAYAQTAVAPFTVRAKPGAPVATPMAWAQLDDPGLDARRWTIADAVEQARTDPWAGVMTKGRALGPARRRLNALMRS
ncbi:MULTISPECIES: non-homologous end-joining DNA ligase [unclassified Streptomyces]|uniref:non-homologous end-joining DNA ligase n=1 Tax=unclassified Streptomyces TaxID=2593676 RepID=UPI000F4FD937|nr:MULTISPECIES: non-homologous end-joining DNA ligase [unclassified Streptomyces]MDH6454019.1 bifunctional non-homologous end joining protein LigD [Streptomyces sp. SAI-119]MDH6495420.1 bifunctional non-homologous end joining protein LigD [Streptomyces sp. SAI-149]QUC57646.1 non-homologous end-joining DNA ligase [Streptomyces sp. A2-16]